MKKANQDQTKLNKNFIYNTIGSVFSSFFSLILLIVVSRINGVDTAGVFTFAFSTACLFFIVGTYSGRAFQVTDNDKTHSDIDYIYSKIITCLIMIVLSIIFCIIKGYNFDKSILIIVLSLYKLLEAFSEGLYAVIQKNEELYKVGISLFVKTLLSIILFVIVDLITNNLLLSSITIIISNLIIIVLYDFNNVKNCKIKITKINYNNVFTILKIGFFTFVFSILTQYVINSTRYAIDNHLEDKFQTIYGIIIMPSTFIALLAQLYIHPFLNKMKKALTVSKKEFNIIVIKLCLALFASGLLCIVVAYSLGIPVLEFLYNVDLKDYKNGLLLILGGATIYSNVAILSTALITMRSTLSQVIVFVNVSIIAYFLSNMLVSNYSMNGAVYSYLSIMIILFIEYIITYIFILNKRR